MIESPQRPSGAAAGAGSEPVGSKEAAVFAAWRAAENQLYPLAVADSDLYEGAVRLVGEVCDILRAECSTTAGLIEATSRDVLARCPSTGRVRDLGFDPSVAYRAACAQRLRELLPH